MAGLTLDEFWRQTPHENGLVIRGYYKRHRNNTRLAAWHAAHVSMATLDPDRMVLDHEDDG